MGLLNRMVCYDRFFAISLMGERNALDILQTTGSVALMSETEKLLASIKFPNEGILRLSEEELLEELMGIWKKLN
jgi:hypothetical protein